MKMIPLLALTTILVLPAHAVDLGQRAPAKTDPVVQPNVPLPRQGGDTIATATVIDGLPYTNTGTTAGYADDYDEACPYLGSTSPDVVYSFTPATVMEVDIDLCGSSYDTKLYVYDSGLNLVDCNDDFYAGDPCGQYVSFLGPVVLAAGETYFIVVDGYGGDFGDYVLAVDGDVYQPCEIECPAGGVLEGEPPLENDVLIDFNCGCGCIGIFLTTEVVGDANGEATLCATSGWFTYQGSNFRDTDWLTMAVGATGTVHAEIDAEYATYLCELGPHDCGNVAVVQLVEAGPCETAAMDVAGDPGSVLWLWTGPTTFEAPGGLETPVEYDYVLWVEGLEAIVATESASWGAVKSLYR